MDEWLWTTRGDGSGGEWPPHVLPSGSSGNQININFSQFSQPFGRQENQMCNTADAQDSRNLSTLNLGHSEPSKIEMNNSFLAFLSGPYHHLKGGPFQPSKTEVNDSFIASPSGPSRQLNNGSLQVPYPMQEVSSISPISGFGIMANSLGSGIHVTHLHAADMMDYSGHLMKTELEVPFSASVQHSRPLFSQSFVSPESIEAVQPVLYPYNSCKLGVHDTFQGNATTTAVSSFVQGHNTGYFHSSTDRCPHPRTQIKPMMTSEIKSTTFDYMSAHKFVAPRVFCMGTVGEIFLKENGCFGVICFCHNLRMSVAKFCEHCGSSLVNPAEAIHLENGQTIAEWRRLFFSSSGIRVADDNAGWDWTEGTIMANSFAGSWSSNLALPKPTESSRQLEFSGGFVGPGNHMKSSTLAVRTHLRQPPPRNLLSGTCANVLKKNATLKESSPSKRCSGSLLQPSNSWMMEEVNDGHCYNGSKFPLNNGKQIAGYQFLSHEVKSNAINRNPLSQATCGISRNSLSNRMPITSSNVELSLRQPCQQSGRFIDTTAHVQQHHLEQLFSEKQNPYEHVPPRSSVPSIKEQIQQNLPYDHCETINSRRTILRHGNPSAIKKTETGCSGDETNKSSSISLFLSHLNTFEGHAPPPINENFLTGKEKCVSKLLNSDYYYEGSDTNMFKEMIHGAEKYSEMNETDNSQVIDGGKGIVYSDPDCSYTLLKPEACQGKMMLEPKVHYEAIDERFLQSSSEGTDMAQRRTVLIADADERNLNGLSKNTENYNGQEYDLLRPMDLLHSSSSRAGFGPEKDPSLGFLNSSSKSPLLPSKQTINAPHHLLDESIQFPSQKQMADMCLRNHNHIGRENISPNRNDKQVIPCCPLTIEMQRNSLKQDLMPQEEGRQCYSLPQEEGRQCYSCLQQGSSKATEHPLLSCHICHSTGHPYSPGNTVLNKSYYDTASTSRMPLCSGGHSIQHKYCHVNRTAEPLLLRLGNTEGTCACSNQNGFSNLEVPKSTYGKCRFHGINVKRHVDNRYGNCRHSVLSDCSLGCCCYVGHSGGFMDHIAYDSSQMIHYPNFSRDCIKHDAAPCGFEGCKKEFISDNKDHSTVWREVPGNMKQNSFVDTLEKPRNKFQNAGVVEEQDRDAATSFSNQACPEAEIKENEMSHVCSGCSAPSLTEVSVQINRSDSYNLGISKGKVVQDPVDEGSGIEKCGSSDMTLDSKTGSRKQSYGTPFQSSDGHTNTFNSKCSSKSVNFPCRLQARPSWRAEKGKTISSTLKKLDASKLDSVPSPIHDDLPNSIDQPEQQLSSSEEELLVRSGNVVDNASSVASKASGFKRKRSSVSCGEVFSHERCTDNRKIFNCGHPQLRVDYCGNKTFNQLTNKFNKVFSADQNISRVKGDNNIKRDKKRPKFISLKDMKMFSLNESEQFIKRLKPVVLGNSGIIGNGDCSYSRPAKIVSLRSILKNTARSTSLGIEQEFCSTTGSLSKESCKSTIMNAKVPFLEKNYEKEVPVRSARMDQECFNTRRSMEEPPVPNVEKACGSPKSSKLHIHHQPSHSKNKPGLKEARKRSLDELIGKANFSSDNAFEGKIQTPKCEFCRNDGKDGARNLFQISTRKYSCKACRCQLTLSNSDPFCCVCGSSNKDDNNHLIECSKCSIKVHQACYGILRVPKGRWCCRPCRNNSKNTVCVLCGYEGGAMTRAVKSEAIVRSLFKAWKLEAVSKPMKSVPSSDVYEKCNSVYKPLLSNEHLLDSVNTEVQFESSSRRSIDTLNVTTAMEKNGSSTLCGVQNSITSGVTDPSVTQWVHMVCGLWTPGTRCLNVDTMSTFDVSGASISRKNTVCVMCNRPGGSCIKCRLLSCSSHFHPWCAHQKGLLQSEIEGIDNENVGFYGRCSLHAFHQSFHAVNHSNEDEILRKKEFSCARVEEYKSRKKESAFLNGIGSNERGEWVVPQEQLNAWIYINGQKFCARELVKLPSTEAEADSQKEYARYRQTKGWKQLVVYKSRIHALGLYTSLFIPHGSMVVEYVGEIVGVRVADKREIEYQSGNKLQYKSACYFFRIDKDNIIDATCKGGIARFVNHSCLPNCVAKVISVANEKKVVFFAERDIYPGEEITYDYNFNHEDEVIFPFQIRDWKKAYLQEQKLVSYHTWKLSICRGGNKGFKHLSPESNNFNLRNNTFLVKTDEIEDLVEGLLLPFEVVGVTVAGKPSVLE